MIGRTGKPYTVVGVIGQGAVGYRSVGTKGRYRVRIEHPMIVYSSTLPGWNYTSSGETPRRSITVESFSAMTAAVSLAFAALLHNQKLVSNLPGKGEFTLPVVEEPEPEQDKEEEGEKNKYWCEDCQEYHWDD